QRVQQQGDRSHAAGGHHAAGAAFEIGQRRAKQVAGGVAAAGVVVLALAADAFEAEVRRQHQRRHHGAKRRVAVDARAHGAGGFALAVIAPAHADTSVSSAVRRIASMRPSSLRKASWPCGERSTRRLAGPPRPSTNATASDSGTSGSPSTATTVTGTRTSEGATRCRSSDSDNRCQATAGVLATKRTPAASR